MRTAGPGSEGEFFISVIEILLRKIETWQLQHLSADGRGSPVGADCNVRLDRSLAPGLFVSQPYGACLQIEPHATFAEEYGDAMRLGRIHQSGVKVRARDGVDDFDFVFAVRLKRELPGDGMHHAASHGNDNAPHRIPETDFA